MQAKKTENRAGSLTRYSERERERLMRKQARSGLTKKAFCKREGINLGTFYGWTKRSKGVDSGPVFAEVDLPRSSTTAVEVLLPNGVRVGLCHQGERDDLVEMVRGIAGC